MIIKSLLQRPLISITLLYALLLVILDQTGFFAGQSKNRIAGLSRVEGYVIGLPEKKYGKISFLLKTSKINNKNTSEQLLVNYSLKNEINNISSSCFEDEGDRFLPPNIEPGDILRIEGYFRLPSSARNPGGFDYAQYLNRQSIQFLFYASSLKIIGRISLPFYKILAYKIRYDIITTIRKNLPEKQADILLPMVIGDKSGLSKETKQEFTDAGVIHVLVVSGLNVAYCAAIFIFIFRLFGLRRRYAAIFTIPFIILYVIITGANAPVVRAVVMALFVILSLSLAREPGIYQSLALAALTILIFDPQSLFTASFQLSFAATLGIVYLYPYLIKPFNIMPRWIKLVIGSVFAVSLSAQLAVIPLVAFYFNKVSIAGLLSNLFIVPLVGLITGFGICLYLVHFISPLLTSIIASINYYLIVILTDVVRFFAGFKWSTIHIATPSMILIVVYYSSLWAVFKTKRFPKILYFIGAGIILCGAMTLYNKLQNELRITFLDVGNADAVHISFPSGENWLIDAGGKYYPGYDIGQNTICPYLWSKGVRCIDKVVVTHPHIQHYGGIKTVIENFKVKEIVFNPQVSEEKEFTELLELINKKKIPWKEVWAGDRFIIGKSTVTVLSPEILRQNFDDNCLVLSLDYFTRRIIFTSDMGEYAQNRLISSKASLKTSVLMLPNHDNRTISKQFLAKSNPDYLIASTTRKEFPELAKFTAAKTYSTKTSGAITVVLTPKKVHIKKFIIGTAHY